MADALLPRLPPPQADVLRAALGLAAADAPVTARLLELATVGLLRELAVAGVVVAVDDEQGEKLLKLIDNLSDQDDVQNVYANFEVSDVLVARMSA